MASLASTTGCESEEPPAATQDASTPGITPEVDVVGADTASCAALSFQCTGDRLEVCTNGAFQLVVVCPPGQCSADKQGCTACAPGRGACTAADKRHVCSADGQTWSDETCPTSTKYCVDGQCHECLADGDCHSTVSCQTKRCVAGTCAVEFTEVGTSCPDGVCNGHGSCGSCTPGTANCNGNVPLSCTTEGVWEVKTPCQGEAPFCLPDGTCGACKSDLDCPAVGPCQRVSCEAATHQCVQTNVAAGTACSGTGTCNDQGVCTACVPGSRACNGTQSLLCNAAGAYEPDVDCAGESGTPYCYVGQCVACVDETHCPEPVGQSCLQRACIGGSCALTPKPIRTPCLVAMSNPDGGRAGEVSVEPQHQGVCGGTNASVCYYDCVPGELRCVGYEQRCDDKGYWQSTGRTC